MPNLNGYGSINTHLFVRLYIEDYRTTSSGSYTPTTLLFSDYQYPFTINSDTYEPLGKLLAVTASSSEIRASLDSVSVTISGIPNANISEIVNSRIKGSEIEIKRAFFAPGNNSLISTSDNPFGRFKGTVTHYQLNEQYNQEARVSSNTLVLNCSSYVDFLENRYSGRKTNGISQKSFYASDTSMDRVNVIETQEYNFGAEV